jgi:RNA polymerase sigma-70 factor (ECF subfamily)
LKSVTDTELMCFVKAGQLHRLGELFERHHLRLYNFFLKLCGNRQWSEDMVQETFTRILRYAGSFHTKAPFLPWAFNIARNVSSDYLRKESAGMWSGSNWQAEDVESAAAGPERLRESTQNEARLQTALMKLPAEKRELILLSRVSQLSMADLAEMCNCSVSAVKVRMHRAMEQLKQHFESTGGELNL